MSYPNAVRYFPAGMGSAGALGALDISDADNTTEFTWIPQEPCKIYGFGGLVVEATGTQSTTAGVCSLTIAGTEVSTFTAGISSAIGTEKLGSDFVPTKVAAGATILFKVKTQAVGGTIVGEFAPFIDVEFFQQTDAS